MEKEFQRWTARRKVELLLQLIKGEVKLVDVCREHDLKQSEVESWTEIFLPVVRRGALDLLLSPASADRAARARRRCRAGRCDPQDHRRRAGGGTADDHRAGATRRRETREPQEDPPHLKAQPMVGPATPAGAPPACPGLGVAREPAQRTVGHRHHASSLRPRWLVPSDRDHRLLRPHDRRVAALQLRAGRGGGGRARGRPCTMAPMTLATAPSAMITRPAVGAASRTPSASAR